MILISTKFGELLLLISLKESYYIKHKEEYSTRDLNTSKMAAPPFLEPTSQCLDTI